MKNYTYLLAAALLSCSFAYSKEEPTSSKQIESHHRLYVGPDVLVQHAKARYAAGGDRINVTYNAIFGGIRFGYDYLKPQAFYFGTDGLVALGGSSFKDNSRYWSGYYPYSMNQIRVNKTHKNTPLFANIEQRYGYTFRSPILAKSTLTPFAGIGWYYGRSQFNDSHSSGNWFYGAVGLRVAQQFCENFDVGFNLKAMYAFAGSRNIGKFWGYEVALPFTWHVGASKKWDLQFQPYLLKLDVNSTSNIYGARLQAGYSF